jgi:hypothetical protein
MRFTFDFNTKEIILESSGDFTEVQKFFKSLKLVQETWNFSTWKVTTNISPQKESIVSFEKPEMPKLDPLKP